MRDDDNKKRVTATEVKKLYYTAVKGDMLYIFDNRTKKLLLQCRIINEADPLVTMQFALDLARRLKKYVDEARQDIHRTNFE